MLDSPYVPTLEVKEGEVTKVFPKSRQQYMEADRKKIDKNYKAKNFLYIEQVMKSTIESQCVNQQRNLGFLGECR